MEEQLDIPLHLFKATPSQDANISNTISNNLITFHLSDSTSSTSHSGLTRYSFNTDHGNKLYYFTINFYIYFSTTAVSPSFISTIWISGLIVIQYMLLS